MLQNKISTHSFSAYLLHTESLSNAYFISLAEFWGFTKHFFTYDTISLGWLVLKIWYVFVWSCVCVVQLKQVYIHTIEEEEYIGTFF